MTLISGRKTERDTHIIETETDKNEILLQLNIYFLSPRVRDRDKKGILLQLDISIFSFTQRQTETKRKFCYN